MRPLLCINLGAYVGASCTEQLDAIRAAGFDGYFTLEADGFFKYTRSATRMKGYFLPSRRKI